MPHNGFTPEQTAKLSAMLSPDRVAKHPYTGMDYIMAWDATNAANDIFGYDGWDRETIYMNCVTAHERKIGKNQKDGWGVAYLAKVRITVRAGDAVIIKEGTGDGSGVDVDLGTAHANAAKEAESDAMKRALSQFGNQFGLALYDKTKANVGYEAPAPSEEMTRLSDDVAAINEKPELTDWMSANKDAIGKLVEFEREALKRMCTAKLSGFQRVANG